MAIQRRCPRAIGRPIEDAKARGVATAAVGAILTLLASNGSVDIVAARTSVRNPASGRVLEKNGFTVTGWESSDEGDLLVWTLATAHPDRE